MSRFLVGPCNTRTFVVVSCETFNFPRRPAEKRGDREELDAQLICASARAPSRRSFQLRIGRMVIFPKLLSQPSFPRCYRLTLVMLENLRTVTWGINLARSAFVKFAFRSKLLMPSLHSYNRETFKDHVTVYSVEIFTSVEHHSNRFIATIKTFLNI